MEIVKFDGGGVYYTPLPFPNKVQQTDGSTKQSNTTSQKLDPYTDEIINILKGTGIENDRNEFINFLEQNLSPNISNLSTAEKAPSLNLILAAHKYAGSMKEQQDEYILAQKQVKEEGSGSEIALDSYGKMYVYGEEGLTTIDINKYYENKNNYSPINNSMLLELRRKSPSLAFNSSIINDISSNISKKNIYKELTEAIKILGTYEEEGYTKKQSDQIKRGLEQLAQPLENGVYKYKIKNQGFDTTEDLDAAMHYLSNQLSPKAINTLKADLATKGIDPNNYKNIFSNALILQTNHFKSLDVDSNIDNDGKKTEKSESNKTENLDYLGKIALGKGAPFTTLEFQPSTSNISMQVVAQNLNYPLDKNNVKVGKSNFEELLKKSEIGKVVDIQGTTYGDMQIPSGQLNNIVYDGQDQAMTVYMPFKLNNNGSKNVDLEVGKKIELIKEKINKNKYMPRLEKEMIIKENGCENYLSVDENGEIKINNNKIAPFIVLSGITSPSIWGNRSDFNTDSSWVTRTSDQNTEEFEKLTGNSSAYIWSNYWKGIMFMPLNNAGTSLIEKEMNIPIELYNKAFMQDEIKDIKSNWDK